MPPTGSVSLDNEQDSDSEDIQPTKKHGGTYRSYSYGMQLSIVKELATTPISDLSQKYNVPRSTIFSWENQIRRMNKKQVPLGHKGVQLHTRSDRKLSYPCEVEEEIL